MKLDELKVIVSGAGQGMGRHFALRLAEAGAQVAACDVNDGMLAETAALAKKARGTLHVRRANVASEQDVVDFVGWAATQMGGLNGAINNAGILRDGLLVKRDKETKAVKVMSKEQFDAVLAVNLTGAVLLTREVVAKMVEADPEAGIGPNKECRGVIVNISSTARHGNRGQSNYAAAKAALAANAMTWAREFSPFGIRVGAVAPGMVETPMTQGMNQKAKEAHVTKLLVGRIGQPEDIWLAVKFILECDFFNGGCIDVDGGLMK